MSQCPYHQIVSRYMLLLHQQCDNEAGLSVWAEESFKPLAVEMIVQSARNIQSRRSPPG
ncbi:hypothetical protein SERLADRAFT_465993 [Serpula lacrymans var. lacrymans S7.9]|uniref:Uncharacterized protein n=1 Tax=Serpula lacrymans var. lacrymans (strain S7.9) TaxID=578457 RepID=F8NTC9_SERL9|nr:uncharacterized protein SERLADRAFT_465993 [Serpula lacrymans var. lacrymans S7.9]EGO25601.1 hypothetical protein SERLADRAFT_465993 [Serpula lacrymans var. lacrymans S7.9]